MKKLKLLTNEAAAKFIFLALKLKKLELNAKISTLFPILNGLSVILTIFFINCAAKKPYFDIILQKPKVQLIKFDQKTEKKEYKKEYKKKKPEIKLLNKEWKYLNKAAEIMRSSNYKESIELFNKLETFHNKYKNKINFQEYYNASFYFKGICYLNLYEFDKSVDIFKEIPKNSMYYNYALKKINSILSDNDSDGYIDALEFLKGTNPKNPYSHP